MLKPSLTLSIIIPSLNQGKFIRQTIDSILNQQIPECEILVKDGGSTDETISILQSYGQRINWVSEKDNGQTNAINKGLQQATGDIITYLNSDDYYLPGCLNTVLNAFRDHPHVQWVTGDYHIVNENGQEIQSIIASYKRMLRSFLSFNLLSVVNPIIQPSTFIRREFLNQIGSMDESLHFTMDYEWWLRAIKHQAPLVLPQRLSAFRIHHLSKGGHQFHQQFKEELMVSGRYQKKLLFRVLHQLHNKCIRIVYQMVK